jgi:hypothetical protein
MRRAVLAIVLTAVVLTTLGPAPASAQKPAGIMNAIGLIDFGHPADFKLGSWAKYHMKAQSTAGATDDYKMTVLIAGEEEWWGEDCFWLETVTEVTQSSNLVVASLMSYDVFKDSLGLPRMQFYVRKVINGLDENGLPIQEVYRRPASTLRSRDPLGNMSVRIDTVGTETVTLDKGTFDCTLVKFFQGKAQTGSAGDSTDYTELRETRTTFMSPKVPITHIVREDLEQSLSRKAWMIGKSKDATPLMLLEETKGGAVLVDYGENGTSRLLPESMRITLAESRARQAPPAATRPAPAKPRAAVKKPG